MHNYLKTTWVINICTPIEDELVRNSNLWYFLKDGSSMKTKLYTTGVFWQKIINLI